MPSKAKKRSWYSRGLALPGYNYLGPFNSLDNGEPVNQSDRAAQRHDVMYKQLQEKYGGFAPYYKFSQADQDFIDQASDDDFGGRWGRRFFEWKKRFAPTFAPERSNLGKRPRIEPVSEQKKRLRVEASVSNLPAVQEAIMSGGGGSGNAAGLRETPIDFPDAKHPVTRGPPEYTFASLPYVRDVRVNTTKWGLDQAFRMTSPYDPSILGATATDLNAGAGSATHTSVEAADATDTTIVSARWFDFYSTMYNYYHVVGARWHITIENLKSEPLWVHWLYYNDEVPPLGATNEDIQCWNDAESHFVGCHASALDATGSLECNETNANVNNVEGGGSTGTTANYESGNNVNNRGRSPILQLSGSYKPGQKTRQIHLDSEVENWTGVNANPGLPEKLLFRFKHYWNAIDTNDANSYDRLLSFRFTFRIEYLVEFKELKTGLRWPVERQPITAAVVTNIEEDEE